VTRDCRVLRPGSNAVKTFEEFQALAAKTPLSLRNNLDRINLPILALQQESGRISLLFGNAVSSGRLDLTSAQRSELRERLSEILWCVALLGGEAGIPMQEVAEHGVTLLREKLRQIDPERR